MKAKLYLSLFCVAFFWGTTYLAIRFGLETIPPFFIAGFRNLLSGSIILAYVFVQKKYTPLTADQWKRNFILAIMMFVLANGLTTFSEKYITSGLAAIVSTLSPLFILILNVILGHEKLSFKTTTGILLAFGGILFMYYNHLKDFLNPNYQLGVLAVLTAVLMWSIGTVVIKKYTNSGYMWLNIAVQMLIAGGILTLIQLMITPKIDVDSYSSRSILAVLYLTFFGSIVGYGAYNYLLSHMSSTKVGALSYVNVVVAIYLGMQIYDEKVDFEMIVATFIILLGVFIVNYRKYSR